MSRSRTFLVVASLILATATLPAAADTPSGPGSSGMDGFEFVVASEGDAPMSTRSTHTTSSVGGADGCPTPTDPRPAPRFRDIAGSAHAANIDCVARWGIASGTSATSYAPRRDVTRAQMATFVANLIRATGAALPEGRDRFSDDDGSPHEPNINALANAGVISGVSGGGYAPNRDVTRAQAATILAGAYRYVRGSDLPVGPDQFRDDDGSPHEANINRLANAGVINGLTATRFGHADALKRDQMASLLARFLPRVLAGTIWYSGWDDGTTLQALDPVTLGVPHLVHRFRPTSRYTVNPHRGEFTYFDGSFDTSTGYANRVYVHSMTTGAQVASFRWGSECTGSTPTPMPTPEASPDGRWFITGAEVDYGLDAVEIRDRNGGCVNAFSTELMTSWTWMADGDLLVVLDASGYDDIDADHLLGTLDRDEIAAGRGGIESFDEIRRFSGPDAPSYLAVSNDQRLIAYHYRGDLYVHDRDRDQHRRVVTGPDFPMWPAFSPDDRQLVLRNRTYSGTGTRGELHVVPVAGTTEVRSDGPTQLLVPWRSGGPADAVDTNGPLTWTR